MEEHSGEMERKLKVLYWSGAIACGGRIWHFSLTKCRDVEYIQAHGYETLLVLLPVEIFL